MNKVNDFLSIMLVTICIFLFGAVYTNNKDTIGSIPVPNGYKRVMVNEKSFGWWLRSLPVKASGSPVLDYRGRIYKQGHDSTVAAVVNWNIKGKRMEQCMDILVHFYAEYLWEINRKDKIRFPIPGGYWLSWKDWERGLRPKFKGINMTLESTADLDSSREAFSSYLRLLYAESHTQQFYHAYKPVSRDSVQIGDFIVRKGSKGHAVMIVDMAINARGNIVVLIGHGDTPACQFYLLNFTNNSPWHPLDFKKEYIPLPIKKKMTWDGLRRFF